MLKKLKQIFRVIFSEKNETEESKKDQLKVREIVSFALFGVSLVLTLINVFTKQYLMMYTTIALTVAFAACIFLLYAFKAVKISEVITTIAICFIFSFYGAHGTNEGFAILWIVIVPAVASLFLSYKAFLGVAFYFLVYLIVIFYTPIKNSLPGLPNYSSQFQIRYPVLYLASLILSLILSTQSIYYSTISQNNSLFDYMTNLKNRRFCGDYIQTIIDKPIEGDFTVVSFDINNLKTINDQLGHDQGDEAIVESAYVIKKVFGKLTDKIYRMGGDEFLVFFYDKDNEIFDLMSKIKEESKKIKIKSQVLSISAGFVKGREYINAKLPELLKIAENNMYKDKEQYYTENNIVRRRKSNFRVEL